MNDQPIPAEPKPTPLSTTATTPRHSFSGTLLTAGVVLLVVACIIVVLLPQWLVSPTGIRQVIIRAIPQLHGDVEVDAASIGWFTPLAIDGIRLIPADGKTPPLVIEQIRGERSMFDILQHGGRLGDVTVTGLAFNLDFDEQHVSNLQQTVGKPPARPQPAATRPEPPAITPADLTGDQRVRIKVADARIRITGPWSESTWESEPIDVEATLRRNAGGVREWSLTPLTLLDHARLEPAVAAGVLAYAAPILADATRTGGEFSLVIDEARWPAGRGDEATVAGTLTLHAVDVGPGPLVEGVVAALPGRLPAPPTIRVAEASQVHFRQANRRVWHDGLAFGLPLDGDGQRLDIESSGSVGIDDRSIDLTLALPIPADLPQDRPLFAALAGKTLRVMVEGSLDKPRLKLDESLKQTATAVAADVLESLRRPKPMADGSNGLPSEPVAPNAATGKDKPSSEDGNEPKTGTAAKLDQLKGILPPEISNDPTTDTVIDAVGGLLDEVARRRAEKAAKNKNQSEQSPSVKDTKAKRDRPARKLLRKILEGENDAAPAESAVDTPATESAADSTD